jgi:hypothetical protein
MLVNTSYKLFANPYIAGAPIACTVYAYGAGLVSGPSYL